MSSGRSWSLHEPLGRLAQLTRSAFGHHASGGGGEEEKKMPPVRQVPTFQKAPPHLVANIPPRRRPPPARSGPTTGHGCNPFTRSVTRQVPEIGRPPQNPARNASRVYVVRAAPSLRLVIFFSRPVQRECRKKAATEEQCTWRTPLHPLFPVPRVVVASPPARTSIRCRGEGGIPSVTPASGTSVGHRPPAPLRTSRTDSQQRTADRQVGSRTYVAQASLIQNQPLQVKGTRNFIWYLTRFQI
jgi:hypothetical protein